MSRTCEPGLHTVGLPGSLLVEVAGSLPGRAGVPVKFLSERPVEGGARKWQETTWFVDRLLAGPDAATPLVSGSVARLLAATVLTIFPHTAITPPATGRPAPQPETVQRAVSFIEASAGHEVTLSDIAAAAYVTTRAVQLAFRRHLGTTPMAYLRRVRLDSAHRQLQAANPARETVTAVAYRWGFSTPSLFAADYRRLYGVLPSHTLRGQPAVPPSVRDRAP